MSDKQECSVGVWAGFHQHPCTRTAKVERNGRWYCGMHDPVAKNARAEKKSAEWNARYRRRQAQDVVSDAIREAGEALADYIGELPLELDAFRDAVAQARARRAALEEK